MNEEVGRIEAAVFVDLHWSGRQELRLPDLSGVDLVLLGGDLTNYGDREKASELLARFQAAAPRVLAVCGNTDRSEHEALLDELGIGLDRRAVAVRGVRFAGLSGGLPFGGCPYERSENDFSAAGREVRAALDGLPPGPTVLVSHQPPFGTRCDWTRGRHAGSKAVRELVEELQPDLVLCGHIHEARGEDVVGRSRIVNPGPWLRGHHVRISVEGGALASVVFE